MKQSFQTGAVPSLEDLIARMDTPESQKLAARYRKLDRKVQRTAVSIRDIDPLKQMPDYDKKRPR